MPLRSRDYFLFIYFLESGESEDDLRTEGKRGKRDMMYKRRSLSFLSVGDKL